MKRYTLFILAVVLGMLGIQTVSAQQTQDALYIYRNDGGFNGFFFADIDRIEYSKVDTLGVEHDDYVVQEVYALDTLYRIPLNAIDSVTFVTPETIYKKDVVHTTESDLWNYVIGSDSVKMLILASNTPATLIPKAGDKIVTTKSRNYLPGGFYGLVKSVSNGGNGITVNCEVPDLTELFDQFVCKAAAASVDPEAQARRRIFGNENSTEFTLPVYDQFLKIDLTNISYGLNDNWSLAGTGVLDTGVRDVLTLRVFLAVRTILGINFDYVARMEKKSWFNLDIKGAVSGQFDVPLAKTYTWITDTPFAVETQAGVSVSGTGEMELKIKREHVTSDYAMVQYNDCFYDEKRESAIASSHLLSDIKETSLTGSFTATAGPYFWSCLSLMKKEIGAVGTRYDAGIKAEVSAELKLMDFLIAAVPSVLPAYMIANPTALYDMLNRDGSIKVGPFCTGKIEASLGPWKKEFEMFDVNKTYGFEGGLVPKFSETSLTYDEKSKILTASTKLSRKTLIGNKVGFAAYYTKNGMQAVKQLYGREYVFNFKPEPNFKDFNQALPGIGGGLEVTVYPITNIGNFNYEMLASPYATYTIPAEMEVSPETYDFQRIGGVVKIAVEDNLDRNAESYKREAVIETDFGDEKPWVTGYWSGNNYVVTAEENKNDDPRTASIKFSTYNKDKSINLEKTVTIQQKAKQVPDIVSFEKGTKFYNSDYNLSFSENSDGHRITIGLYYRTETMFTYNTCIAGYYTADDSRMEITIDNMPDKVNDADNPFAGLGLKKGDVIVVTYSQTNEEFKLELKGLLLSFWPPISLEDNYWQSTDGLARFELKDGSWSKYYCYNEYQFMAILNIDQSKRTLIFKISNGDKTKIMLPTHDYYERDKSVKYACPFKMERVKGIRTLSFTLFDYNFVLQACDPW